MNDTASYEGIFGDSATATSTSAGALDSSTSTTDAAPPPADSSVTPDPEPAALSKSGQETSERPSDAVSPEAGSGSDLALTPPPAKRQKSQDRGDPAMAVSKGVPSAVVAVVGGVGGAGNGGHAGQADVTVMGEKELRAQVVRQNRLLEDMARELETLKRDRSVDSSAGAKDSREVSDVDGSILPVRLC